MTSSGILSDKPGKITPKIISEQTRFSYDVFPIIASMLILASCLIAFLVWQQINTQKAIYWFASMATIITLRIILYSVYKRDDNESRTQLWRKLFLIGAYLSAIMICIASLMFYSKLNESSKMVFMLLAIGIVSTALPVLATDLKAYAIYSILCLLPLAFFNLVNSLVVIKLVGAITIVFIGMLMLAAHLFNRALLDSLIFRYRSELLAKRLQIANTRLSTANQELQKISTIDELTGAFNKRYFNQRFKEVWDDHVRQSQPLAALMIDVDHFKLYNDHFGHFEGDHCLKRIADEITDVIHRPRDFLSRFGGEEFIILLPNTNIQGAQEIANRIHAHIKQLAIPHKREDNIDRVTVSIGGNNLMPTKDNTSDLFLQKLDLALYQAKRTGRNKTIFV